MIPSSIELSGVLFTYIRNCVEKNMIFVPKWVNVGDVADFNLLFFVLAFISSIMITTSLDDNCTQYCGSPWIFVIDYSDSMESDIITVRTLVTELVTTLAVL